MKLRLDHAALVAALATLLLSGCGKDADGGDDDTVTADASAITPAYDGVPGEFMQNFDGRDYYIHVPPGYSKDTPIPLLIGFHGACTPASEFWDKDGVVLFRQAADPANFILVIPETKGGCESTDGFCRDFVYWPPTCGDPMQPFEWTQIEAEAAGQAALVDEIATHYNVDPKQIHAWGHSNGGLFISAGATSQARKFATLSSFGMGWGAQYFSRVPPPRMVPFQFVCGTDDAERCAAAQQSEQFLRLHGYPTRIEVVEGAGHSINDLVPGVGADSAFQWMHDHPLP